MTFLKEWLPFKLLVCPYALTRHDLYPADDLDAQLGIITRLNRPSSDHCLMPFQSIYLGVFLLVGILLSFDIKDDLTQGSDISHVAIEAGAAALCFLVFTATLFYQYRCWTKRTLALQSALQNMSAQRDEWQKKARDSLINLSLIIDQQFERWSLTDAEKEVGLLMLKGLSHKEIANIRSSSEKTVRQQAGAIYAKSGLEGKSQLSAFFLEDLMIPKTARD